MESTVELIKYLLTDNVLTIVVVNYLIMEGIKKLNMIDNKYIPILSMFCGLLIGLLLGYFNNADLYETAVIGFISGGFTSGLYKVLNPTLDK